VDDAIDRYLAASETNDIDALIETLTPDAEVISPISGRMVFRGKDDLRILLTAVYGSLKGLRWHREVADGDTHVVIGDASVGPLKVGDAMVFELADDGRINRISPHLRPWLALTLFALVLGPKVARHPRVVQRALRRS
jgi:hypothetical protein